MTQPKKSLQKSFMIWAISMENLNIKYAIDFINKMGYTWDGKIVVNDTILESISSFDIPQIVKLNGEEKGLILYNPVDDSPECIIYWFEKHGNCYNFVTEKNLTNEWAEFLREKNII